MFKRPLFAAALLMALAAYLVTAFIPQILKPKASFKDREEVSCEGRITRIEDNGRIYLEGAGINGRYCGKVLVIWANDSAIKLPAHGNTVSFTGTYDGFNTARNFGNFDEEEYYGSLGIFFRVRADGFEVKDGRTNWIRYGLYLLKTRIIDVFREAAGTSAGVFGTGSLSGVFSGLVTGDRSDVPGEIENIYRDGGIMHILAISGLHISFLGMGLYRLIRRFTGFFPAAASAAGCVILYCIFCGAGSSAVRACVMLIINLIAIGLGKTYDMLNAAAVAAILLLISNPFYITNSGFQMSFAAVMAMAIVRPAVSGFVSAEGKVSAALCASVSIAVSMMPLISANYFEVPLYSFLLNIVVIPLMGYILVSALLGGTVGMASIFAGRFVLGTGAVLLRFIEMLCILVSLLPFARVVTGYPGKLKIFIFYAALFLAAFLMKKYTRRTRKAKPRKALRAAVTAGLGILLSALLIVTAKPHDLKMLFFDTGQGECVVLKSPSGKVYMIDGGSSSIDNLAKSRLVSALKYEGISRIDYSLITHPDTDHMSGVIEILEANGCGISISKVLIPYVPENENYAALENACIEGGAELINVTAGQVLDDGQVRITFLHPENGFSSVDLNGYSLVAEVDYGDFNALFTGDLPQEAESHINWDLANADSFELLKVAHHGSKFSTSDAFVRRVSPEIAVISAGVRNSYGHPHEETLDRLRDAGADIFVTAECGEIIVTARANGRMKIETKL